MDRKKHRTSPYPAEFRERAVQMVVDHLGSYRSPTAAVSDIARKLGCSSDSLRVWYSRAQRDAGKESGPTGAEREAGQKTIRWSVFPPNAPRGAGAGAARAAPG